MFHLNFDNLGTAIVSILGLWIVLSFGVVLLYMIYDEADRFVKKVRANHYSNKLFREIEVIRNDFE